MKKKRKYRIRYNEQVDIDGIDAAVSRKIQIAAGNNDIEYEIVYEASLFELNITVFKDKPFSFFIEINEYKKGLWHNRFGGYVNNIQSLAKQTDYKPLQEVFELMNEELKRTGCLIQTMMAGV